MARRIDGLLRSPDNREAAYVARQNEKAIGCAGQGGTLLGNDALGSSAHPINQSLHDY